MKKELEKEIKHGEGRRKVIKTVSINDGNDPGWRNRGLVQHSGFLP
jgi:hypothetical protein